MAMRVTRPLPKYDGRRMAFFDTVLERLGSMPGVADASVSNQPPPGLFSRAQFAIDGRSPAERLPSAFFTTAGPRSWIYGVTPEPVWLGVAALTLFAVAALATTVPAWRASRIDPIEALRRD